MVGTARFELTTSCSQSRRSTRLSYVPSRAVRGAFLGVILRGCKPLFSGRKIPGDKKAGIKETVRPLMADMDFSQLVDTHYRGLYQFALSLARSEADAADLTQETFLRWAEKGSQLRDTTKSKSWLYTTLYRLFLNRRRHVTRFPHEELSDVENQLPSVESDAVRHMEGADVMEALSQIDEVFRTPLVLFYLEDHSYQEIAEILEVPPGTVMSRLWRGKALLRSKLEDRAGAGEKSNRIVKMNPSLKREA